MATDLIKQYSEENPENLDVVKSVIYADLQPGRLG